MPGFGQDCAPKVRAAAGRAGWHACLAPTLCAAPPCLSPPSRPPCAPTRLQGQCTFGPRFSDEEVAAQAEYVLERAAAGWKAPAAQ